MKIYKRVMAATLAASVGTTSVMASFASDIGGGNYMNVTPGGTYDINGKGIYTTESVYFRFGPAAVNYEPIFHISPPELEASCAGFNLKGLFVSILGWDRISKMLKASGASFAWGVVVGLVYSLPGIFSSFKMLNTWAKKIMQLMQNSCNFGKKIGKDFAESTYGPYIKEKGDKLGNWIKNLSPEDAETQTEQGDQTAFKALAKDALHFLNSGGAEFLQDSEDTKEPTPEEINDNQKQVLRAAYSYSAGSIFLRNLIYTSLANGQNEKVKTFLINKPDNNSLELSSDQSAGYGTMQITLDNIPKILSDLGITNSDEKRNQYLNFAKAIVLSNSLKYNVVNDSVVGKLTNALKENSTKGASISKENSKIIQALKDNKYSDLHAKLESNLNTTHIENFGRYVAAVLMGVSGQDINSAKEKASDIGFNVGIEFHGLGYDFIAVKEDKRSANIMELVSESTLSNTTEISSSGVDSLESDIPVGDQSFKNRALKAINEIVNNDKTPQSAFNEQEIPLLSMATLDKLRILKQTPFKDRSSLINGLADLNTCSFGLAVIDYANKNTLRPSKSESYYVINGDNVNWSYQNVAQNTDNISDGDINIALNAFSKGIASHVISELDMQSLKNLNSGKLPKNVGELEVACAKLLQSVESDFNEQDKKNRQKAASLTK